MLQSRTSNSDYERDADCRKLHDVLCSLDIKRAFQNDQWFSLSSNADVFDMRGTCGEMRYNLNDKEIIDMLEHASLTDVETTFEDRVHTRIIFIDEVLDGDSCRLQCTSELLQAIIQTYSISPQFPNLLERQHMPGRLLNYSPITQRPTQHQFWYSVIFRSGEGIAGGQVSSKSVLGWTRFCVWVGRNLRAKTSTMLVLRCPKDMKTDLVASLSDKGEMMIREPMLVHAFIAQRSLQITYDFTARWADPIYKWEKEVNEKGDAAEFTTRSRLFLTLARQISQVSTDYDILNSTLENLKAEQEWINDNRDENEWGRDSSKDSPQISGLNDVWNVYLSECGLLKTYANLYEKRTQIAINECFAMINQRDAELNAQMASESTQIARSSYEDGQSLRIIQIFTMIFLPASLISGIFGMAFFNTGADENGNVRFSVSKNWWWYPALTIPVTTFTALTLAWWKTRAQYHPKEDTAQDLMSKDAC